MTPRILIIAGSDSGGGAGIQADIKTVTMLGGHAMTAITAITAQNTLGVQAVMPVPTALVLAQIESCVSDIGVDAVKIGMLGSAETAHAVADALEKLDVPIVFDPVMVATSGDVLADAETIAAFARLMRIATLVTPNLPEMTALLTSVRPEPVQGQRATGVSPAVGSASTGSAPAESGADLLAKTFGTAILEKGGHGEGDVLTDRLITSQGEISRWSSPRIVTVSTHGTGCTLASAIAISLAEGCTLKASVTRARTFVRLAIQDAPGLGGGHGPMGHQSVRLDQGPELRLNQITLKAWDCEESLAFYAVLGLRQIVATDHGYARFEAPGGVTLSVEEGAKQTLFFECDDLDATIADLRSRGINWIEVAVDQPWLWREARLRDPAGNVVCLYQAGENRRYPPWRMPDA